MKMETAIHAYFNYVKVEKGLSPNTIAAYTRDLRKFARFAEQNKLELETVSRDSIVDFLGGLYRARLDSRSVARHLVSVRNFFRFALAEELITADPTLNMESPKVRKSLPTYLRMEEVDRLLAQPDVTKPFGIRDRAIIELLYSTGLRVTELVNLRVSDLEARAGCLRCIGKGDKERLVPVGRKALTAVEQYLGSARPALLGKRQGTQVVPYLFLNHRGKRIGRIAVWRMLGQYRKAGGHPRRALAAHLAA